MKSKIIAILLTGMMLMPTVAYAKDKNETSKEKPQVHTRIQEKVANVEGKSKKTKDTIEKIETKINRTTKKLETKDKVKEINAATETLKTELKAKHEIMKTNTLKINELKKQIKAKKQELTSILSDIKAGKKTLSADQLELLTSKIKILKETAKALKTLPRIDSDVELTQKHIKGKNFETALASLDKVIAKQEARYAKLVELNTNIDSLLAIARQAQPLVPATADTSNIIN